MRIATTVVQMLVRATGLVQIVLGTLFWTGNFLQLIPVHMLVGFVLVLGLLVMAALGLWGGAPRGLVALAVVWCVVVPVFGINQSDILPGDLHWIVRVLHLAVGLAAMGTSEALATRIRGRAAPAVA